MLSWDFFFFLNVISSNKPKQNQTKQSKTKNLPTLNYLYVSLLTTKNILTKFLLFLLNVHRNSMMSVLYYRNA